MAGVDLHHVEAGRLRPLGRLAEGLDDLLDLVDGHRDRDGAAQRGDLRPGDVGSGFGLLQDEALPAGVRDLDAGLGPVRLDRIGQQRQPRDVVHPGDAELAGRGLAGVVVHPGVLDDDHPGAALRHFLVVAEQAVGYRAVRIGKPGVLRSLDDPVLETDVPDPAGLEQARKTGSHSDIPSLTHEPLALTSIILVCSMMPAITRAFYTKPREAPCDAEGPRHAPRPRRVRPIRPRSPSSMCPEPSQPVRSHC